MMFRDDPSSGIGFSTFVIPRIPDYVYDDLSSFSLLSQGQNIHEMEQFFTKSSPQRLNVAIDISRVAYNVHHSQIFRQLGID